MVLGDGPQKTHFMQKIQELGLTENVIFLGNVDNSEIKKYQEAADVFLFTSKSETQGIVLLEAMAVGNPVVAVDATGVRDIIKNGENGYLTAEDACQWARAVESLLENDAIRQQMKKSASQTAQCYREEEVAAKAELCYRNVCEDALLDGADNVSISRRYVIRY